MSAIKISNEAFKEFKDLLKNNQIETDTVRIVISGIGWGGPSFGLVLDEQKENDIVEKVEDMTFLVEGDINKEFGCLAIRSGEENGYGGLSIEPEKKPESGCSSCSSCS